MMQKIYDSLIQWRLTQEIMNYNHPPYIWFIQSQYHTRKVKEKP